LQYLRERKRQEQLGQIAQYSVGYDDVQEEHADQGNHTFSETELLEAISYLPEHHRLVFNLYVVDNFSHAQIAAQLGISEGTSKSHLARARKKIRELLHDQLCKNIERKRGMLFLIFPYKLWNVDRLFAETLNGFSIQPEKELSFDEINFQEVPIPHYKPAFISNTIYLKTGVWGITAAVVLVTVSNWHFNSDQNNIDPITSNITDPMSDRVSRSITEDVSTSSFLFSDSITATISDNPIIVVKTKNSGPMKNLSTLGGLLMASLAFDSSALMKELPVQFIDQQLAINRMPEPARTVERIKPDTTRNSKLLSGSFYASQLLWSDAKYELLLFGSKVRVDLNTQKFTGSGKFSFLNGIKYIVVDGTPMKLNERINLADKKYRLKQLNAADGMKKYGDPGKDGAVEITLAE
jgi:hypothetical protein